MPANIKYLSSPGQRFAKITAGIIGGYLVSISAHLAMASWYGQANVIMTLSFSGFILWAVLLMLAFLARSGWKIWGVYVLVTMVFVGCIYLGKMYNAVTL